jgi:putative methionine-R-sulfoxide reductase with GAF domain
MTDLDVLEPTLTAELAGAGDVAEACALTTARLRQAGLPLVSIYLLSGDLLRCLGVHGYGQLYDGIPPGVGVIGRAFATGTRQHVHVGADDASYRPAAGGVVEELALPLHADGFCVGVLNAESTRGFAPDVVAALAGAAELLSAALTALGGPPAENQAQRLVRYATSLSEATDLPDLAGRLLAAARTVSGLSTAALVSGRGALLLAADGTHAAQLRGLSAHGLAELLPWVSHGRAAGQR